MTHELKTFEQLMSEHVAFTIRTFTKATPFSSLAKLEEEVRELAHEIQHGHENLAEEYVDCIMCLLDSAARMKINPDKIKDAFAMKLEKNLARKWSRNDDNTYSHVKVMPH